MNLKSNHKWKDRIDATTNDDNIGYVTEFALPANGRGKGPQPEAADDSQTNGNADETR
jgi:hypothetical protein